MRDLLSAEEAEYLHNNRDAMASAAKFHPDASLEALHQAIYKSQRDRASPAIFDDRRAFPNHPGTNKHYSQEPTRMENGTDVTSDMVQSLLSQLPSETFQSGVGIPDGFDTHPDGLLPGGSHGNSRRLSTHAEASFDGKWHPQSMMNMSSPPRPENLSGGFSHGSNQTMSALGPFRGNPYENPGMDQHGMSGNGLVSFDSTSHQQQQQGLSSKHIDLDAPLGNYGMDMSSRKRPRSHMERRFSLLPIDPLGGPGQSMISDSIHPYNSEVSSTATAKTTIPGSAQHAEMASMEHGKASSSSTTGEDSDATAKASIPPNLSVFQPSSRPSLVRQEKKRRAIPVGAGAKAIKLPADAEFPIGLPKSLISSLNDGGEPLNPLEYQKLLDSTTLLQSMGVHVLEPLTLYTKRELFEVMGSIAEVWKNSGKAAMKKKINKIRSNARKRKAPRNVLDDAEISQIRALEKKIKEREHWESEQRKLLQSQRDNGKDNLETSSPSPSYSSTSSSHYGNSMHSHMP